MAQRFDCPWFVRECELDGRFVCSWFIRECELNNRFVCDSLVCNSFAKWSSLMASSMQAIKVQLWTTNLWPVFLKNQTSKMLTLGVCIKWCWRHYFKNPDMNFFLIKQLCTNIMAFQSLHFANRNRCISKDKHRINKQRKAVTLNITK